MSDRPCRVKGCVAVAAPAPDRPSLVCLEGVCAVHQQFAPHELKLLINRGVGLVAPLERITGRVEYERADGTRYGWDMGRYYDIPSEPR